MFCSRISRRTICAAALTFLDKALAVVDAKRLLAAELGVDALSQSRLAGLLGKRGYRLSQGLISQMAYATERLLPVLPQALESGIGRPQVVRLRALDRVVRALWLDRAVDSDAEYDGVFEALCRRYDTPAWDIADLRRALEAEIAERADISLHAVSLEIDARLVRTRGRTRYGEAHRVMPVRTIPPTDEAEPGFGASTRRCLATDTRSPRNRASASGTPGG